MIERPELPTAIAQATWWHDDVTDKNGQPFIGHPLRVMAYVSRTTGDDRILSAAVLHDVLEDTECTENHLLLAGLETDTLDLVKALTREPGIKYFDYIARIKDLDGPLGASAKLIKLCDLQDNLDPRRHFAGFESMQARHLRARELLES